VSPEFLVTVGIFLLGVAFQAGVTRAGFRGTHARLDRVNGRLDKHDDELGEHGERLARLEGPREGCG
jgi:hypothetical protein